MAEPVWHLRGPKPYEVQLEALRRSEDHDKFGYFLEQGLGKTALVINDYVDRYASDYDTVVVACPNSFKLDWATAPSEWGVNNFTASVWPKQEFRHGRTSTPHINVINFESIRSSGYDVVKSLLDKDRCFLIADESSAIKNFKSDTARATLDLSKRTKGLRLLNGTPMTQNVMDLFPQLKCLGELDGMNPYVFRYRFAKVGGYMGKQVVGVQNEEELHAILNRCSFRALKTDWSDLPEKIYRPLKLEMTNNQLKHYREMLRDFYTLVDNHEFEATMVLTQMDKLRQITSGILMNGDDFRFIDPPENNPKIRAAVDIVGVGSTKLIVVHQYTKMGQAIFDVMKNKKFNPAYIRGGMKPEELIEQKKKFNNDPTCRVLVGQIQSSSKAHTLLGGPGNDRCSATFFHDHTFSLLDRLQMEDRNHRGEQDRAVVYYDPVMSAIDQTQVDALGKKQDIARAVVDAVRATRGVLT